MATFEITKDGKTFEVTADTAEQAMAAVGLGEPEDLTTMAEDIQGAGTKLLDGLLLGFGDEAAALGRAGIDMGVAALFGEEASLYGGDFDKAYEATLADTRDVEQRFSQQNPGVSLTAEVIGGVAGLGAGGAALRATGAATRGATRGANLIRGAGVGTVEGATYALGEKEGDIADRYYDLTFEDVLITGLGTAAGGLGGVLTRGSSAESRSLGELASIGTDRVIDAAGATGATVKELGGAVGDVAYKAVASVSPETASKGREILGAVSDVSNDIFAQVRPGLKEIKKHFDEKLMPVQSLAKKRVSEQFGSRLKRGAINGQVMVNKVDDLFKTHKMSSVRDAIQTSPRAMAAMADAANAELKKEQREVARQALREELGEELYGNYNNFIKAQEAMLDDIAQGTQSVKRTYGYMSVARELKKGEDLAADSLEKARLRREAREPLRTTDASAKDKTKLARLNEDGTGLSSYGADSPIMNPVDSHHFWMRSHGQLNEMNKVLGLRGAQNADEMKEIAKGNYFPEQLRSKLRSLGHSEQAIEDGVEIYNQVVWGSHRAMSKELQALRNLGYATTIGNPYGALLQFHDLFNAAWAKGTGDVMDALAKRNGFDITTGDVNMMSQIHGEIVNAARKSDRSMSGSVLADWAADRSQRLVDWSMEKSRFAALDQWNKGKIMTTALGSNFKQLTKDPAAWRKQWRNTFDKAELMELEQALLKKDTNNPLVKQLALLELADLQPISPANSSLYQLQTPNMRIAYMLKGFAMTQLDLVRNRIRAGLKKPNGRKEVLKDMLAYFIISGGGFGLVNETRQMVKLQAPDYSNVPTLAFYQMMSIPTMGAFGGNQYGAYRFAQDPVGSLKDNFIPPTPMFDAVGKDLSQALQGKGVAPDKTLESLPIIGPFMRGINDMGEE